jgi:hypothetical protein
LWASTRGELARRSFYEGRASVCERCARPGEASWHGREEFGSAYAEALLKRDSGERERERQQQ